jgi:hypothetical protein
LPNLSSFFEFRKHVEAYQMISGRLRPNGGQWIGQESGVGEAEFVGKAGVKPPQQFNEISEISVIS